MRSLGKPETRKRVMNKHTWNLQFFYFVQKFNFTTSYDCFKQVTEVFGYSIAVPTCGFLLAVTLYPQHGCWAVSGTGPDRTRL